MKKLLAFVIGLSLTGAAFADTNEDVLKKLQEMQEQIRQQQEEIADLRQELDKASSKDEVSRQVQEEVNKAIDTTSWSQTQDVAGVTLQKHIKDLQIKGDLRVRYERQERDRHRDDVMSPKYDPDGNEETRDRFRTRLRLGATWKTTEGWEIGVGLASGGSDATSTNDTWSQNDPFETGDLRIDYAYAKHKLVNEEDISVSLTLGQHKNPFVTSGLLWDGDVRLAGVTLATEMDAGPFVTIGAYEVLWGNRDQTSAQLLAGQLGFSGELAEGIDATLATSYYHYNDATNENISAWAGGPATAMDDSYSYQIADIYGEVNAKVDIVKVGVFAHVWKNFGAEGDKGQTSLALAENASDDFSNVDPEDADLGWAAGFKLGVDKFSLGYMYGHVEADSAPFFLKDSDFGDTAGMTHTDVEGHKISAGYNVTKNFGLGLTYMNLNEIDGFDRDGELYQLDFKYKF